MGGDREGCDGGRVLDGYAVLTEGKEYTMDVVKVGTVRTEGKQLRKFNKIRPIMS